MFVDTTAVNVALPALREDLDAGLAAQQWTVEAYLVTLAALTLVGGALADRVGRRRVFAGGVAGFAVTSILCAAAPTAELLVAARALQGAAGALLVPASLALVGAAFGDDERAAAVGSWTAWTGISIVVGPAVAGALIELVSWRLVFAINVPLGALALALARRGVGETRDVERTGPPDVLGALLAALGLGALVLGLVEQPRSGFGAPLVWAPLAGGAALLAAFVVNERRAPQPMLPLSLFRVRDFAAVNLATLLVYGGLYALSFFSAIFFQQVAGWSALEAALAFVPTTLVLFALSRPFGALADRVGPRPLLVAGPLTAAAGTLLFLAVDRGTGYAPAVLVPVLLFGLGLAITVAPLTATALGSLDSRHAGIASGVNNAVARVAGLLAIAAVGALVAARFDAAVDDRLAERSLSPAARAALAGARERAFTGSVDGAPPAERAQLDDALGDASESAFHAMALAVATLLAAGAAVAAVGVAGRRRARAAPVA